MTAHFILVPEAPNMIGNVGPRSQSINLGALEQQQFLIGTPIGIVKGNGILFNHLVWMRGRVVSLAPLSGAETGNTEIIFGTGWVGTGYQPTSKKDNSNLTVLPLKSRPRSKCN